MCIGKGAEPEEKDMLLYKVAKFKLFSKIEYL